MGALTEEQYDRTFATNVKGALFTVQKALSLLRDGTSFTAASTGIPAFNVHGASRAAIRSFARNWILDPAPRGIRVNVLAPGWNGLASSKGQLQEMPTPTKAGTPLRRLATPREIARAALFLASDESSYVTGTELFVDGGAAQV